MITTIRQRLSGFALLAIFALALVALGFAHRMPAPTDTALTAYLQLGGDIGDICGADLDGDGQVDHGECPACHIVSAAIVPATALALRDADLILIATSVAPRENRAARAVLDLARGLRAPPLA